MIKWLYLFPSILFGIIMLLLLYFLLEQSSNPTVYKPMPELWLDSPFGQNQQFATERLIHGDKFMLFNVFASWCVPCIAEHQFFMKEFSKKEDIKLYGIAWKDTKENVLHWLNKMGNPYQEVAIDSSGIGIFKMGIIGVPESFLVSPDGMIVKHIRGPLSEEIWTNDIVTLLP